MAVLSLDLKKLPCTTRSTKAKLRMSLANCRMGIGQVNWAVVKTSNTMTFMLYRAISGIVTEQ